METTTRPFDIGFAGADCCGTLSCRNGTCRTCLCRLDSGQIAYEIEWPGLTREEKAEVPARIVVRSFAGWRRR